MRPRKSGIWHICENQVPIPPEEKCKSEQKSDFAAWYNVFFNEAVYFKAVIEMLLVHQFHSAVFTISNFYPRSAAY